MQVKVLTIPTDNYFKGVIMDHDSFIESYRTVARTANNGMDFFFDAALDKLTRDKILKEVRSLKIGKLTDLLLTLGADKLSDSDQSKLCDYILERKEPALIAGLFS